MILVGKCIKYILHLHKSVVVEHPLLIPVDPRLFHKVPISYDLRHINDTLEITWPVSHQSTEQNTFCAALSMVMSTSSYLDHMSRCSHHNIMKIGLEHMPPISPASILWQFLQLYRELLVIQEGKLLWPRRILLCIPMIPRNWYLFSNKVN